MMGVQHKTIGFVAGCSAALYLAKSGNVGAAPVAVVCSTVGAMLPDMDHDRSRIGRIRKEVVTGIFSAMIVGIVFAAIWLWLKEGMDLESSAMTVAAILLTVGTVIAAKNTAEGLWMFRHRGIMHTNLVPAGLIILSFNVTDMYLQQALMTLAAGYVLHLFADCLTRRGCPVLFPLTRHNIHFLKLRADSSACWFWVAMVSAACLLAAVLIP